MSSIIAAWDPLIEAVDVHSTLHLLLKLSLHLCLGILLLCGVEDAHGLKVQCTNTSHECLLQILLHHMLIPIHRGLLSLSIIELLSQGLYFFLISCAYCLQFRFYGAIELFFVSLYLILLETFLPSLEDFPRSIKLSNSISMF